MKYALYYYDACPFCQRVLQSLPGINAEVEKRNVMQSREFRAQQQQQPAVPQCPVC